MKLFIGADHAGYELKNKLYNYLAEKGHNIQDCGCYSSESVDYPDYAKVVCNKVLESPLNKGILICGTGIGINIAANKIKGIRSGVCSSTFLAERARSHNNTNVLSLAALVIDESLAKKIVDTWLNTDFEGGRHQRRVEKLEAE